MPFDTAGASVRGVVIDPPDEFAFLVGKGAGGTAVAIAALALNFETRRRRRAIVHGQLCPGL